MDATYDAAARLQVEVARGIVELAGSERDESTWFHRKRKAPADEVAHAVKALKQACAALEQQLADLQEPVSEPLRRLLLGKTLYWLDPEACAECAPFETRQVDFDPEAWPAVLAQDPLLRRLLATSPNLFTWTRETALAVETRREGYKFREFGESAWDGELRGELLRGVSEPEPLFPGHADLREFGELADPGEVVTTRGDPTDGEDVVSRSEHAIFVTFLSTRAPEARNE